MELIGRAFAKQYVGIEGFRLNPESQPQTDNPSAAFKTLWRVSPTKIPPTHLNSLK